MRRKRLSKSRTLTFDIIGLALVVVAAAYASIIGDPLRGKVVFQQSCFLCHGNDAKGTGYLAPSLPVPPADFTNCRITSEDPVEMVEGSCGMVVRGRDCRRRCLPGKAHYRISKLRMWQATSRRCVRTPIGSPAN